MQKSGRLTISCLTAQQGLDGGFLFATVYMAPFQLIYDGCCRVHERKDSASFALVCVMWQQIEPPFVLNKCNRRQSQARNALQRASHNEITD